jgi:DNA helicase II / ATP-dependent DNA helicase PcrA
VTASYKPTDQQRSVISHDVSAFVIACPGAGKTRTMVERARRLADNTDDKRGVVFLSFTNTAVDELEGRLWAFGLLMSPLFPSFIGTFDRFLWQFLIAPFGILGCPVLPRLVPDKGHWEVKPYDAAQSLPLKCFDRTTGKVDPRMAKENNFDVTSRNIKPWETLAKRIIETAHSKGQVDFGDVRALVRERLADEGFSARVGAALAARFREIVVDEAQDCNPSDLAIVGWLRESGVTVKVICDPYQSIYKFRGGVTDELFQFESSFAEENRLRMSGNFRSTPAICAAIIAFRPSDARTNRDEALGPNRNDGTPVHLLSYSGAGVSAAIGVKFVDLLQALEIPLEQAPVLASRLESAAKAIGQPRLSAETEHKTLRLAQAAMDYHFAFAVGNRHKALMNLHRAILTTQGHINAISEYQSYLAAKNMDGGWRAEIIAIANELKVSADQSPEQWLVRARETLAPGMIAGLNVNQRLKSNSDLVKVLAVAPPNAPPRRTIHSVKGKEYSAVCVVMTSQKAGRIIDYLDGQTSNGADEDARKIYVAVSRAQRLLAIAVPKSSAGKMQALLAGQGCQAELHQI